jgi:sugar phosphate isomerase/epimerase
MTRRHFLERTTLSAAAVALAGLARPAAQGGAGMWISLNGSTARGVNWPDYAHLAARHGFGGVDFNLNQVKQHGAAAAKALLAELKLQPTIASLPLSIQAPEAQYSTGFAQLEADAKFMAELGATRMMAVLPTSTAEPIDAFRAMYTRRLTAVAEVLRRHNVRLGLEFLGPQYFRTRNPNVFIYTLPDTVALAEQAGPNVGAVLDIWHWYHSGGTTAEIVAAGKDRIVHVHMSDAKPMPADEVRDNMRLMPGEGGIDTTAFLQTLRKIGYTGGLSPEPLGRIPMDMPAEESAKLAADTTRAVMKKAGL